MRQERQSYGGLAVITLAIAMVGAASCSHKQLIPGTTVADTKDHREVLAVVEKYRQRLVEKNVEGLLILASEKYFEDSGTPRADDDYGYSQLKDVLVAQLQRVLSVRYEIQFREVAIKDDKATVNVYLTGSFELGSEMGERYRRIADHHRFTLHRSEPGQWKFLSGM
jgi:hypothetical protein